MHVVQAQKELDSFKKQRQKMGQKYVRCYPPDVLTTYSNLYAASKAAQAALAQQEDGCEDCPLNKSMQIFFEACEKYVSNRARDEVAEHGDDDDSNEHNAWKQALASKYTLYSSDDDDVTRVVNSAGHQAQRKAKGSRSAKTAKPDASERENPRLATEDLKVRGLYAVLVEYDEGSTRGGIGDDESGDDDVTIQQHCRKRNKNETCQDELEERVTWIIVEVLSVNNDEECARAKTYSQRDNKWYVNLSTSEAGRSGKKPLVEMFQLESFMCPVTFGKKGSVYNNRPDRESAKRIEECVRRFQSNRGVASEEDSTNEWEVEAVIDQRITKFDIIEYHVKWSNGENSWEPRENLANCDKALKAFAKKTGTSGAEKVSKGTQLLMSVTPQMLGNRYAIDYFSFSINNRTNNRKSYCLSGDTMSRLASDTPRQRDRWINTEALLWHTSLLNNQRDAKSTWAVLNPYCVHKLLEVANDELVYAPADYLTRSQWMMPMNWCLDELSR